MGYKLKQIGLYGAVYCCVDGLDVVESIHCEEINHQLYIELFLCGCGCV